MAYVGWMIKGPRIASSDCSYGSPCEFNAPTTNSSTRWSCARFIPLGVSLLLTATCIATGPANAQSEDCLTFDNDKLSLQERGGRSILTNRRSSMVAFNSSGAAKQALAFTRSRTAHCFIGRNNTRPNRRDYIFEYWKGNGNPASQGTCTAYDKDNVTTQRAGEDWIVRSGNKPLALLSSRTDADAARKIIAQSSEKCLIGLQRRLARGVTTAEMVFWRSKSIIPTIVAASEQNEPEMHRPDLKSQRRGSVDYILPFGDRSVGLKYEIVDGQAIFEGDIVLGRVDAKGELIINRTDQNEPAHNESSDFGPNTQPLIVRVGWQYRWPGGVIPFQIATGFTVPMRNRINNAIAAVNTATNLTLQPRSGEANFVQFAVGPAAPVAATCSSPVGMTGGQQTITFSDLRCSNGSIQHEILHTAGAWHEHTRSDRDAFVTYNPGNVNVTSTRDPRFNFVKHIIDGIDIGAYDYGSIMHYSATAFGSPAAGGTLQTLTPVNGGGAYNLNGQNCISPGNPNPINSQVMGQRNCLSSFDIAGINQLYPFLQASTGGEDWGDSAFATSIAFGDVDGDNRDEVAIARLSSVNDRVFLLDDATTGYAPLWSTGSNWGSGAFANSVAFGDVDGDGRDELGFTRRTTVNERLFVVDRTSAGTFVMVTPGNTQAWGSGAFATSVAFGNIDSDAAEEMVLTRKSSVNERWMLFDDSTTGFARLTSGGQNWGSSNFATTAAFGDVDGDGRDEFAIGRQASGNARYFVYRFDGTLRLLHEGGHGWGSGNFTTGVAFGDVDGDGRDEFGVARRTTGNARYFVLDDINDGFRQILSGGSGWGSGNFATAIAFGDVDDDGRDEIGIARQASGNARYWVLDDAAGLFLEITSGGQRWGSGNFATGIAFGDVNNDGRDDLGLSRKASGNMRYAIFPSGG